MIHVIPSDEGALCYFVVYTFEIESLIDQDFLVLYWESLLNCSSVFSDVAHNVQTGLGFNGDQPSSSWGYYARHGLVVDDYKLEREHVSVGDVIEQSLWTIWCEILDIPIDDLHLHQFKFTERRRFELEAQT